MAETKAGGYALVIHGGAGVIERDRWRADEREIRLPGASMPATRCSARRQRARCGQAAVVALEESPRFNAGKGAVYNAEGGTNSMPDHGMLHRRRRGGRRFTVRNPIRLARTVMRIRLT